jgi:hypothetical protein
MRATFLLLLLWCWGLKSEPTTLNHSSSPFLFWVFFEIRLGLASNRNPPDLCLLSSWDFRREHWCPAFYKPFKKTCLSKAEFEDIKN